MKIVLCASLLMAYQTALCQQNDADKPDLIINRSKFNIIDDTVNLLNIRIDFNKSMRSVMGVYESDKTPRKLVFKVNDSVMSEMNFYRGNIMSISYYALKSNSWIRHGKRISFYENGSVSSESNYVYGEETGRFIMYDKDGSVRMKGMLRKGGKVGKWIGSH